MRHHPGDGGLARGPGHRHATSALDQATEETLAGVLRHLNENVIETSTPRSQGNPFDEVRHRSRVRIEHRCGCRCFDIDACLDIDQAEIADDSWFQLLGSEHMSHHAAHAETGPVQSPLPLGVEQIADHHDGARPGDRADDTTDRRSERSGAGG